MPRPTHLALALLTCACGFFPEDDVDTSGTTVDPATTDVTTGGGPMIDPDPESAPPAPIDGDRGAGSFNYYCVDDRDPACLGLMSGRFPTAIAIGGQFLFTYTLTDGTWKQTQPQSASQDRIAYFGVYQALVAGDTVMYVRTQEDGKPYLLDLTTLHVATPSEVVLQRNDKLVKAVFLAPDDEATISAVTRDDHKLFLAGTLEFTWSLPDDEVAVITTTTAGGVRLRALAGGTTTLTATLGELSASVPITVSADEPASTSDTDTSADTDTSTTADTSSQTSTTADTTGGSP